MKKIGVSYRTSDIKNQSITLILLQIIIYYHVFLMHICVITLSENGGECDSLGFDFVSEASLFKMLAIEKIAGLITKFKLRNCTPKLGHLDLQVHG